VLAEGDVGLDRREVAPAVEDDRQLASERQAADMHRDHGGCLAVEQRPAQQLLGAVTRVGSACIAVDALLAHLSHTSLPPDHDQEYRPPGRPSKT
jgi:hypothetical protein